MLRCVFVSSSAVVRSPALHQVFHRRGLCLGIADGQPSGGIFRRYPERLLGGNFIFNTSDLIINLSHCIKIERAGSRGSRIEFFEKGSSSISGNFLWFGHDEKRPMRKVEMGSEDAAIAEMNAIHRILSAYSDVKN